MTPIKGRYYRNVPTGVVGRCVVPDLDGERCILEWNSAQVIYGSPSTECLEEIPSAEAQDIMARQIFTMDLRDRAAGPRGHKAERLSELEFGDWKAVPGFGQQVRERFSKEMHPVWVWRDGVVTCINAYLVERQDVRSWKPGSPGEWEIAQDAKVRVIASEPREDMGYSDPFKNFSTGGDNPLYWYALDADELRSRVRDFLLGQKQACEIQIGQLDTALARLG